MHLQSYFPCILEIISVILSRVVYFFCLFPLYIYIFQHTAINLLFYDKFVVMWVKLDSGPQVLSP